MNDDKAHVLGQIRLSLQTAHLPAARATIPPRGVTGQGTGRTLIESFRRELEPLGGASYVASSAGQAIDLVLELLRDVGGRDLLMWDDPALPLQGVGDAVRRNGYTRLEIAVPADNSGRRTKLAELERANAGITGALAGIADTGSLALVSSPVSPRLASLLPPAHIALLRTAQLFPDMASFFAAHPDVTRDASNLTFVTGPSRTADIELTLQRGVHGPKFLHVILLDF